MKLTSIAARLREVAINMEAFSAREGDYDFPDEMVLPLIVNAFTDDNALKFDAPAQRDRG